MKKLLKSVYIYGSYCKIKTGVSLFWTTRYFYRNSFAYMLPLIIWIHLRWNLSGGLRNFFSFLQEWRFGRSRSFKVIDLDTNRKRVCDFLLVRRSNLGPILHRFGDIAGFRCSWSHPYSTLILGVFSLHQIAHVGGSPSRSLKLFDREIISEVFQPVWKSYLNVTDRWTDDILSHNRALCSIAR